MSSVFAKILWIPNFKLSALWTCSFGDSRLLGLRSAARTSLSLSSSCCRMQWHVEHEEGCRGIGLWTGVDSEARISFILNAGTTGGTRGGEGWERPRRSTSPRCNSAREGWHGNWCRNTRLCRWGNLSVSFVPCRYIFGNKCGNERGGNNPLIFFPNSIPLVWEICPTVSKAVIPYIREKCILQY